MQIVRGALTRLWSHDDCCSDRTTPRFVEASIDNEHWTEIAHQDGNFSEWSAASEPVRARWIHLTAARVSVLQLDGARVLQ